MSSNPRYRPSITGSAKRIAETLFVLGPEERRTQGTAPAASGTGDFAKVGAWFAQESDPMRKENECHIDNFKLLAVH